MYFSDIRYVTIIVGCEKNNIIDFFNHPNNEDEQEYCFLFVSGNNPAFACGENVATGL